MLTTLRIKNLALVEDLTVDFRSGFNALTGETGAGKSVIIGGIQLLLGGRSDRSLIRSGTEQCVVEAVFDVSGLIDQIDELLEALGLEPCEGGQLFIRRAISQQGSSRQFVNGSPCQVSALGRLGELLVDFHGPHDHQSLNDSRRQLDIVDACGDFGDLRQQLADLTRQRTEIVDANAELTLNEAEFARQVEILEFQIQEIRAAGLQADEEQTLENAYQRASNAARIQELCQEAMHCLQDGDPSAIGLLHQVNRSLNQASHMDEGASRIVDIASQVSMMVSELAGEVEAYVESLELDPSRLHELENRYSSLQSLKKKYGPKLEDILSFASRAEEKLTNLQQREARIQDFQERIRGIDGQRMEIASEISSRRAAILDPLSRDIQAHLADLGFRQCQFEIRLHANPSIDPKSLRSHGFDTIEFLFSPNPGEPLKPLKAVASSGEMARVMLGIKTVLASRDSIPLLIFDEVDANVGGETASIVGLKLRSIGQNRQALCITHLAPVAACADSHFFVEKEVVDGRTISFVRALESDDRVREIARMLGGTDDEALIHARALLERNVSKLSKSAKPSESGKRTRKKK